MWDRMKVAWLRKTMEWGFNRAAGGGGGGGGGGVVDGGVGEKR